MVTSALLPITQMKGKAPQVGPEQPIIKPRLVIELPNPLEVVDGLGVSALGRGESGCPSFCV